MKGRIVGDISEADHRPPDGQGIGGAKLFNGLLVACAA